MEPKQLADLLNFAVDAAKQAGDLTLKHFHTDVGYDMKSDDTPVTIADRGSEELLRNRIEKAFPAHGILGEEFGVKEGSEPARWILDPIDGTYSFICRVPLYAVLVGFEWKGEMLAGVIHMPALKETVFAARGVGCTWHRPDGSQAAARVSDVCDMSRARLLHGGAKLLYGYEKGHAVERLRKQVYAERSWSDAYGHLLVATGRAEMMLDPVLALWDTAALLPVVTEAGGTFTDWQGNTTYTAPEVVSTNGHLFEQVMACTRH